MKKTKLIVTDLDGTLLNGTFLKKNNKCSEYTKEYLRNLKNSGHTVVIATGRIHRSAIDVCDGADFADYVISDSGSTIYDMANKEYIFKSGIDKKYVDHISSIYNKDEFEYIDFCDLTYYNKLAESYYNIDDFVKLFKNKEDILEQELETFHINIVLKQKDNIYELTDKLRKQFSELKFVTMQDSFSDRKWIEVFNDNISKYNSIKKISDIEGIANEDIIAFGDGLNDIDMIKNSGVGVAMGNALDVIKESADYIALSNDEDGVVRFLENYLN